MGSAKGAAKALKIALLKNPNHLKEIQSKGGKAVKKQNRAFFKDRKLAARAGRVRANAMSKDLGINIYYEDLESKPKMKR